MSSSLQEPQFRQRLNVTRREPQITSRIASQMYKEQQSKRKLSQAWITHDGPPFTSGVPHIGHFYNKTQKDFVNRFQLLRGKCIQFVPGFDCYGVAMEELILKNLTLAQRQELEETNDPLLKRELCRMFVQNSITQHLKDYERWGILAQNATPYITASASYEAWVMRKFGELLRRGVIYRGARPVFWSVKGQRIMGEEELEERNELRTSYALKFPVVGFNHKAQHLKDQFSKLSLLVFVKQPWKICGTQAVSVNKDLQYSVIKRGDENLLIASQRLGQFMVRLGGINHSLGPHGTTLDQGIIVQNPLTSEELQVFHDGELSPNIGTGAGLICPGHEVQSLRLSSPLNLSREGCLSQEGILTKGGERVQGKYYEIEGNEQIVQILKEKEAILAAYDYNLGYQYSKSFEQKSILLSIDAWYLHISEMMKSDIQRMISKVKFTPDINKEKNLFYSVKDEIEVMEDWCISQNNNWGIPIPSFKLPHTKDLIISDQIIRTVASIVEREGADVWFQKPASYFLSEDKMAQFQGIQKNYEVFDCWFDSALSWTYGIKNQSPLTRGRSLRRNRARIVDQESEHISQLRPPAIAESVTSESREFGAPGQIDLVIEGYDQHAGWFLNSFIIASALKKRNAPFKEIKTHGLLLDSQGRKMSKSLGNVINPVDLIEGSVKMSGERKYGVGVQVLRLWTAFQDKEIDISLAQKDLEKYVQKLKNMRRIMKLSLKMIKQAQKQENPGIIDSIFTSLVTNQLSSLKSAYDAYDFKKAVELIVELFQDHLLGFYLRCKQKQRELKLPLFQQSLKGVLIGMSPILSITAEQAHQSLFNESVFEQKWPQLPIPEFKYSQTIIQILLELRRNILYRFKKLEESGVIKHKEERVELAFVVEKEEQDEAIILQQLDSELQQFFGFDQVRFISKQEAEEQKGVKTLKKGKMYHKIGNSKLEFKNQRNCGFIMRSDQ